jgi:hypothetical protein
MFAATDVLSYNHILFLIQTSPSRERLFQDPEGVRFEEKRLFSHHLFFPKKAVHSISTPENKGGYRIIQKNEWTTFLHFVNSVKDGVV